MLRARTYAEAGEAGSAREQVQRAAFACVSAVLLAVGCVVLLYGSATFLVSVVTEPQQTIVSAERFLDATLLAALLLQLAHALRLPSRGLGLGPVPFLIAALIAILRRLLDVAGNAGHAVLAPPLEIALLAGAAFAVARALVFLRERRAT